MKNINTLPTTSPNQQPDPARFQREIGSKVLSQANFETRQKDIVESSFNRARSRGEKLPGKNNERRNYAYLSRLEKLINKYGNNIEKRLWQQSADRLIIKPENIPESYWQTQEQILRDNGQGHKLNNWEKEQLTNEIISNQKDSIASWSNYLGDEQSPYPLWFKIFAFDGISKMGIFDKNKKQFAKRDEHTVAAFPKLNAAVLAKVHDGLKAFYGEPSPNSNEEAKPNDEEFMKLIKSGSFNKLYSYVLLKEKPIPKTPERTEDIHGEWLEYLPGEEEKLAAAAEGTPWCVASPSTGRNYLGYGSYGYDNHDNYGNRAKFILFHLQDPETGILSPNACASIRLNTYGNVAEISGLNDGQGLEDSLVPIVEEKVKSLPGGKKFLEAFADKRELIRLDQKMQSNEDLAKEELEFIYEIHRPIKKLDTYRDDPRISELRMNYNIGYALDNGVDTNQLIDSIDGETIAENLDALIAHGAKIDISQLVDSIDGETIAENLDTLIAHGAKIDINQLVGVMSKDAIAENLDTLLNHGASINSMGGNFVVRYLDTLIDHGANINQLVDSIGGETIAENLDTLLDHGASINQLVDSMDRDSVVRYLDTLIDHGANINQLVGVMGEDAIAENLDTLLSLGADANRIAYYMSPMNKDKHLEALLAHGYKPDPFESFFS